MKNFIKKNCITFNKIMFYSVLLKKISIELGANKISIELGCGFLQVGLRTLPTRDF